MKDKEIKEKVLEKCNFLSFHCLVYIFFVYLQPNNNI